MPLLYTAFLWWCRGLSLKLPLSRNPSPFYKQFYFEAVSHYVAQVGLEFVTLLPCPSGVLRLQVCAAVPGCVASF